MFSREVMNLLSQVITSWQVIAVTVALVAYLYFFNYVASNGRIPRAVSRSRPRRKKAAKEMAKAAPDEAPDSEDINDALGLEEVE